MKLTKGDWLKIWDTIDKLKVQSEPRFGCAMARNRDRLMELRNGLKKASEFGVGNERWKEYGQKEQKLIKEYSKDGGRTVPPGIAAEYISKLEELQEEYKDVLEERSEYMKSFEEILKEEEEIEVYTVLEGWVPNLSQQEYNVLLPLIKEGE